jgi:streptogramin lyase
MRKLTVVLVLAALLPAARAAAAPTLVAYPLPAAGGDPNDLTTGPDGKLWIARFGAVDQVVVGPGGSVTLVTEFPLSPSNASAQGITTGADGRLWFGRFNDTAQMGRIGIGGTFANIPLDFSAQVGDATTGPDGNVWATALFGSPARVIRFTSAGMQTNFNSPANTRPVHITSGPDGALWLTETVTGGPPNRVARLTTSGVLTEFFLASGRFALDVATGPDGNVWTIESGTGGPTSAVRMTPSGTGRTEFQLVPSIQFSAALLGSAPDGNLWAVLKEAGQLARITPAGAVDLYPVPSGLRPGGITVGPDGNVWFVAGNPPTLVRVGPEQPASGGSSTGTPSAETAPPSTLPGPADLDAPQVSGLRVDPRAFAVARGATAVVAKKAARGTTLRFTLSETASTVLSIERAAPGRRLRGTCRKPTRQSRKGRKCTRYLKVGTLTRPGQTGPNAVLFTGRIGRRALRPGGYRVVATARDAAGNVTGTPPEARFTVLRG